MSSKKLYLVTGKGGVGKTITALSLVTALKEKYPDKNIYYNNFGLKTNEDLAESLSIPCLNFMLNDSAKIYISRKLKSKTVATWIMKTPFFKALFNIVPSLGNMITLGHIIDHLETHESDILVADAPSSGHLLTILEAPRTFENIFKSGPIVKDIHRMLSFISNPETVKVLLLSIPTELSVVEAFELSRDLRLHQINNQLLVLNNIFSSGVSNTDGLPEFLQRKINNEKSILDNSEKEFHLFIPMINEVEKVEIIKKVTRVLKDKFNE